MSSIASRVFTSSWDTWAKLCRSGYGDSINWRRQARAWTFGISSRPSEYLIATAITISGLEDPLVLRFCADKIGIDNIIWAIDYSYQPTAPAVGFLEAAPRSDHERVQVASGNAERIFRLRSSREPGTNWA